MQFRLWSRFTLPLIGVSLLLLLVGVMAAWSARAHQRQVSDLLAQNVASLRAAQQLEITLREIRTVLNRFLLTGETKHLQRVPELRCTADEWRRIAEQTAITQQERQFIDRLNRGYSLFFDRLLQLSLSQINAETISAVQELNDRTLPNDILAPAHDYLAFNNMQLEAVSRQTREATEELGLIFTFVAVSGSAAGLLAGLAVVRQLRRTIEQLQQRLGETVSQLREVIGPISLASGSDLSALDSAVQSLAEPISRVIARLAESRQEALRAEQLAMVGQMAAGIAHEVRNPLTAIRLLVQTAQERNLRERDLRVLEEETSRLERLISTFLDFARPPGLEPRLHDLRTLLEHPLDVLRAQAELKGVRFVTDFPKEPTVVNVDGGQIRQVLFNLVQNALDVSGMGATITIIARIVDETGELDIRVADEGPGLPCDLGPRIFEPFVSNKVTGLGLGLSICRRIIEAHKGRLSAVSRADGGAEFRIRIPASRNVKSLEGAAP